MGEFCTGIGSRKTPLREQQLMTRFARLQRRRVRSGGAEAADESYESNWNIMVYLPEAGFRGKRGHHRYREEHLEFADTIIAKAFPYNLKNPWTRKAFQRNVFQVLGLCSSVKDIVLSDFVICWTPDGATTMKEYKVGVTGGTGIAINIADLYKVPVFNLQREDHYAKVERWCRRRERTLGLRFDPTTRQHRSRRTNEVWLPPNVVQHD